MKLEACPLYDCCVNKKRLEHCSLCDEFPCETFEGLRDPSLSEEEAEEALRARQNDLLRRKEIGTERWLGEKERLRKKAKTSISSGVRNAGVKDMQCDDILRKLKSLSNPKAVEGMARYGINPENTYGVSIPNLRRLAKEIGVDRDLALELWASAVHEARILASMIDDPKVVTEEQMESWVKGFDSWDVCDQCCMNLFEKTKCAVNVNPK